MRGGGSSSRAGGHGEAACSPLPTQPPPGLRLPMSARRAFLAAALAQGLCEVLLVVTKEVEEQGSWLQAD